MSKPNNNQELSRKRKLAHFNADREPSTQHGKGKGYETDSFAVPALPNQKRRKTIEPPSDDDASSY
jgi:hypothetical protein